jgi:hypothetical protein
MVVEKTKTYTRTTYRIMTREEVQGLFKLAHEKCKAEIKPRRHEIGGTHGGTRRKVLARPKGEYMACIKRELDRLVEEKLRGAAT